MKDLVLKVGEYEKDGEKKSNWLKLGVIVQGKDGGEYALIDPTVNLAGVMIKQRLMNPQKSSDMVMASVFDRQNRQQSSNTPPPADDFNDDIPF